MTTGYPFVGPHMVERPVHYMYSAFDGAEFLSAWLDSRRAALAVESQAIREVANVDVEPNDVLAVEPPGACEITTFNLLDGLATHAARGRHGGVVAAWREVFLRKFEFAKRLRASYGPDLKAGGDCVDLAAYSRLAFLLATAPALDRDLRCINALLKANDLSLSTPRVALDRRAQACLAVAVGREIAAVRALCERSGVASPAFGAHGR